MLFNYLLILKLYILIQCLSAAPKITLDNFMLVAVQVLNKTDGNKIFIKSLKNYYPCLLAVFVN
mgnify:CR=1 FL=1